MKLSLLLSKGFVIGLLILIVNDFSLKDIFGNWITGKLSDFAGIFIFPIFLTALSPKTVPYNYIFTVLFFIFWKTELSQPLLNSLNALEFPAGRVIDYNDFIAFMVLPFSYRYCIKNIPVVAGINYQKALAYLMGVLALLAFTATTIIKKGGDGVYLVDEKYKSKLAKPVLLDNLENICSKLYVDTALLSTQHDTFYIAEFTYPKINETDSFQIEKIVFTLEKRRKGSRLHLYSVKTNKSTFDYGDYNSNLKYARKLAEKLMIEPFH